VVLLGMRLFRHARRRVGDERGVALVLAVVALAAIGAGAATVMEFTSSNVRTTGMSASKTHARAAAEAGINQALAILGAPTTNALDPNALPARTLTFGRATVTYSGTLTGSTWALTSTAVEPNPASAGRTLSYTLTASSVIYAASTVNFNAHSYDYIMSTATGTPGGCDMTIADGNNTGNPVTVAARLYVMGNLCVGTTMGGHGMVTGAPLEVKGKVQINDSSSRVGSPSTPIGGAHIGAGCQYQSSTFHANCSNGNGTDRVWSTPLDATVDPVSAPVPDWSYWYTNAAPGPSHACTSSSGTIPSWDNDTTRNNSVATVFNLTPAASYSCVSTVAGLPTGTLTWDATNKLLTISGTMFIDGSAKVVNTSPAQYNGQGVLYLSGTFLMPSGSKLCASLSSSNCDIANWNPNTEMFGIIVNGSGGQDPATVGIWMMDAQFQGALVATNKIRFEGTTSTAGPAIGSEVEIGYNVSNGGASAGFSLITKVPIGLPGVPNAHASPQPPTYGSG
jgi:uncharacterized protein YceK